MGFELGFALYRRRVLATEELDRLDQHLRVWRTRIIGYDWNVLRDPQAASGDLVAWGTFHGQLPDVIAQLHAAVINARDLIRESRLAVADTNGPLAWNGSAFEYNELAERPAIPTGDPSWVSLAASRSIPEGRSPGDVAMSESRRRPTTRGAATLAIASLDTSTLVSLVLAPPAGKVSDLERTAAVERLAELDDPAAHAALVFRARQDGTEKKWTATLLRGLASGRGRCHWATPILAFDRGWRGAAEALVANVEELAIPHLERLPIARLWTALALLALDAISSPTSHAAKQRLLARVPEPLPAARLATIDAIAQAHRATGPDLLPALAHVRTSIQTFAARGGDAQTWLAHQREAGQRVLSVLDGEVVTDTQIALGLAALAEFAVTGRDPVRLDEFHRLELLKLESAWLGERGYNAP